MEAEAEEGMKALTLSCKDQDLGCSFVENVSATTGRKSQVKGVENASSTHVAASDPKAEGRGVYSKENHLKYFLYDEVKEKYPGIEYELHWEEGRTVKKVVGWVLEGAMAFEAAGPFEGDDDLDPIMKGGYNDSDDGTGWEDDPFYKTFVANGYKVKVMGRKLTIE